MIRWSYLFRDFPPTTDGKFMEQVLNELGEKGWEVVSATRRANANGWTVLMKRPGPMIDPSNKETM